MALLGTFVAAVIALPLGFLGARNVLVNALAHFSIRRVFDGFRGVDQLIWALAFVRAVGLGPLAGVLAIAAADICVLAKLFAEAIENADPRQKETVEAVGGSRLLAIRFGLLPQVLPVLLAQVLYGVREQYAQRGDPGRGWGRRHRIADRRAYQGSLLGRGVVHHHPDFGNGGGDRSGVGASEAAADRLIDTLRRLRLSRIAVHRTKPSNSSLPQASVCLIDWPVSSLPTMLGTR